MGILSEIDMMNRDAEDDAFEVSSDSETVDSFSEEFEPVEPQKPDQQAEDEEARKKAEFDAAEAKRKAEWEAKQAQKKLREQQELDRLAAMSDDDVMQASMNRVSQDTERLTRRNMKLCVMEDVQTECLADPAFARLVMNPKKKMLNCFHYINRKAREYLEQESLYPKLTTGKYPKPAKARKKSPKRQSLSLPRNPQTKNSLPLVTSAQRRQQDETG